MNPIIEKVARATNHAESEPHKAETGYGDIYGWDDVMPAVRERHYAIARAAIRATLEHLKDHPSERVICEGESAASIGIGKPSDDEALPRVWKAMLSQALAELDA